MLKSIHIKNFRSVEDLTVRLDEPLVALVGRNGAGKTNLIHAIQLAADLCVNGSEPVYPLQPRDPREPTGLKLEFRIGGSEYCYGTGHPNFAEAAIVESLVRNGQAVFERTGEEIRLDGSPFGRFAVGTGLGALAGLLTILPKDHPSLGELRQVSEYLSSIQYYSLQQGFQEHAGGVTIARSPSGARAADPSPLIEVGKLEKWKQGLAGGGAGRSVQMRLLHLWQDRTDDFEELIALVGEDGLGLLAAIEVEEVGALSPAANGGTRGKTEAYRLLFTPARGLAGADRPFIYSGLSAGTWRILQLLTYLVFDKNSCMLVEQPEDSIHEGMLEKLIDVLKSYSDRTQLICTTHSSRVTNLIGVAGLRLVTARDGLSEVHELTAEESASAARYLAEEGTLAEFMDLLKAS